MSYSYEILFVKHFSAAYGLNKTSKVKQTPVN